MQCALCYATFIVFLLTAGLMNLRTLMLGTVRTAAQRLTLPSGRVVRLVGIVMIVAAVLGFATPLDSTPRRVATPFQSVGSMCGVSH